jgi:glycosyltransferase involved in cell wall biosynthesis
MSIMNYSNVSVYITVRNESKRIESCLRTFSWADEIFVFDKNSDDATVEIAKNFATQVINIPNSNEKVGDKYFSKFGSREWCLFITASDLMHPDLVGRILACTTDSCFENSVIGLPYRYYNFGLYDKNNPFDSEFKYILIRRSHVVLNKIIHHEIGYNNSKTYKIVPKNKEEALYHLTNITASSYVKKLHRYIDIETSNGFNTGPRSALASVFKALFIVMIKKRTIFHGYNGFALSAAYLSYYLLKYLALWDQNRIEHGKDGQKTYKRITDEILELLESNKKIN